MKKLLDKIILKLRKRNGPQIQSVTRPQIDPESSSGHRFGALSFYKIKNRGFTLLETIVAIFILLLSITGPTVMAQNGLRAAYLSRDQITAFFLAQDAMEYIKNVKDDNGAGFLGGRLDPDSDDWLDGLGPCVIFDTTDPDNYLNGCTLDVSGVGDPVLYQCINGNHPGCLVANGDGDGEDDKLLHVLSGNEFEYLGIGSNSDEESIFARTAYVYEIVDGQEIEVTVKVRWKSHEGIGYREIEAKEYMTNWIGKLAE